MSQPVVQRMDRDAAQEKTSEGGEAPESQPESIQWDQIQAYRVAEFVTMTQQGSPVCWPLAPDFENSRLIFSTGYVYPTKARNAQRNPRVAALFSDPTASSRTQADPLVLIQGLATVFDQDLQRNTERYVDQLLHKGPLQMRLILRMPGLRQLLVGYLARIWIEVRPQRAATWNRTGQPPESIRAAIRPEHFEPGPGIEIPQEVFKWLQRYNRPPVLAFVDRSGWPAAVRLEAEVRRDHIVAAGEIQPSEGAPGCLTYHRLIGNYLANDTFLIRGHFDAGGRLIPEKIVGYGGTQDDRGLGSLKLIGVIWRYREELAKQLRKESRPIPVVRPTQPRGSLEM